MLDYVLNDLGKEIFRKLCEEKNNPVLQDTALLKKPQNPNDYTSTHQRILLSQHTREKI